MTDVATKAAAHQATKVILKVTSVVLFAEMRHGFLRTPGSTTVAFEYCGDIPPAELEAAYYAQEQPQPARLRTHQWDSGHAGRFSRGIEPWPKSSRVWVQRDDGPVAIVFKVPGSAVERVAFCYSPLMEAVLSLHVLVEPKHHPLQHDWVRSARRLSAGLRKEIDVFAFAYRDYFPEFVFPAASGQLPDFDGELRRLRELDGGLVRLEFAVPLLGRQSGGRLPRDPAALDDPQLRERLLERTAVVADAALAEGLVEDPAMVLARFTDLLQAYWDEMFEAEWRRIEPDLAASVVRAGRVIAARGIYGLLASLSPEVRSDPLEGRFWLERLHDHEVEVGAEEQLILAPSVYVWPHVRVNCDAPWPLGMVFSAASVLHQARPRIAPARLTMVLRALADDTRLRALRLIAERPRSTQELAPLVGVTEAALSKHLRILTDAGLLERRREGYYVLYRLRPDSVATLGPSLDAYLSSAPEEAEGS